MCTGVEAPAGMSPRLAVTCISPPGATIGWPEAVSRVVSSSLTLLVGASAARATGAARSAASARAVDLMWASSGLVWSAAKLGDYKAH